MPVAGGGEDGADVDGGGEGEGVGVDFVAEFAGEVEECWWGFGCGGRWHVRGAGLVLWRVVVGNGGMVLYQKWGR